MVGPMAMGWRGFSSNASGSQTGILGIRRGDDFSRRCCDGSHRPALLGKTFLDSLNRRVTWIVAVESSTQLYNLPFSAL